MAYERNISQDKTPGDLAREALLFLTHTLVAFVLNLAIVWAALRWAALLGRLLGEAGARAVAKVFALILAAIGVTFIRRGLMAALASR